MSGEVRLALEPVAAALDDLGIRYRIGGSVASSAYGMPRSTLDVDLVAEVRREHAEALSVGLADEYYIDRASIVEAVASERFFNLIHFRTMVKIDVFVLEAAAYDRAAFERCQQRSVGSGAPRTFPMATAEDTVLRKLLWYRAVDEVSERQWADVLGMLRVQGGALDREYLDHWAAALALTELLSRARHDAATD